MQESVKFLRLNLLSSDQLHDLAKFDMSVHSQIELHTLLYFLVIGKSVKLIKIHAVHPFLLGSSTGPSFANFCNELIRYLKISVAYRNGFCITKGSGQSQKSVSFKVSNWWN